MDRERDDSGQYAEQITSEDVLSVFQNAELPVLTATEVSETLDCSRPSAYNKLEDFVEQEELYKKKVGARAAVYILLDE